jgi:hypothetical protein
LFEPEPALGGSRLCYRTGTYFTNRFTMLTARGGRTGTFEALETSGLPAGFRASLSYTDNTAVLNLLGQLVPRLGQPAPPTFTLNHINVGTTIENFFNSGGSLPPAFVPLFGLTGSDLTSALDQLHEAATGAHKVGFRLGDRQQWRLCARFQWTHRDRYPDRTGRTSIGCWRSIPTACWRYTDGSPGRTTG